MIFVGFVGEAACVFLCVVRCVSFFCVEVKNCCVGSSSSEIVRTDVCSRSSDASLELLEKILQKREGKRSELTLQWKMAQGETEGRAERREVEKFERSRKSEKS